MLATESQCLASPDFLQALGHLLNNAGRYAEALDRLEAAIMLDPNRWAAHLEYALALEGAGDHASAHALIEQLAGDPTVDPAIRQELIDIQSRNPETRWTPRAQRNMLGLSFGYDDNLMGATRYSNLELTLPEGALAVSLDPTNRPKSGRFVRLEMSHENEFHTTNDARWRYIALGSYRRGIETTQADLGHLALGIQRVPLANTGVYAGLLIQQLYQGGRQALWQTQTGAGLEHTTTEPIEHACRIRLGGEWFFTRYPDNAALNGKYTGILLQTLCSNDGWLLQIRAGQDNPDNTNRPGGAQQQRSLRLGYQTALSSGWLSGEYEFYQQKDAQGYSSLLDNNARRTIERHIWRMEYRWPTGRLTPYIGMEVLDQRANLALFAPRNAIVTMGVRHLW